MASGPGSARGLVPVLGPTLGGAEGGRVWQCQGAPSAGMMLFSPAGIPWSRWDTRKPWSPWEPWITWPAGEWGCPLGLLLRGGLFPLPCLPSELPSACPFPVLGHPCSCQGHCCPLCVCPRPSVLCRDCPSLPFLEPPSHPTPPRPVLALPAGRVMHSPPELLFFRAPRATLAPEGIL